MLIIGRSCRFATSKSLKSCAGVIFTELGFMDTVETPCEECEGRRFRAEVLEHTLGAPGERCRGHRPHGPEEWREHGLTVARRAPARWPPGR